MILWINGAFGAGKTQTAFELHRRIPNSFVYDPENAGYFIRKNIPHSIKKPDFQEYPLWREFNYAMLKHIACEYDGVIIAPMTVVDPVYFEEIVGRLRTDGMTVKHFALCAPREVILQRLKSRGERSNSWGAQQAERCIEGLSQDIFREHIDTVDLSVSQVAERIADIAHIPLLPDHRGAVRKKFDQIKTQLDHFRFFN
ncbi:AAA family ATPase [Paenibacillus cellulositrophicus]|uniref:AAA family ATPase n=1 Tax=Paenibacillus cellulositrophicus TaxID=562959 RepID=UPI003F7F8C7F